MASLLTTQLDYRRRLLAADRDAARQLVAVYADVQRAIETELEHLTRLIRTARDSGQTVNQSWLFQQQRYRSLLAQAASAYEAAATTAVGTVTGGQAATAQLGTEAAEQLVRSLAPPQVPLSWSRLPTDALQAFVGFVSDGSPLDDLFRSLGPQGSAAIRSSLLRGIGLGLGPREIARGVRDSVGMSLTRALTISRTEMIRSYREAQSESYRANSDVVKGKMWHAQLDDTTCPVCVAMHGTELEHDEEIESHPNCRCTAIPRTESWADMGFEGVADTNPDIEPGPEWFDGIDSERQAAILGPGRQAAFSEGRLSLADMIGRREDPRWGPVRYVLPLDEALRRAGRRAA